MTNPTTPVAPVSLFMFRIIICSLTWLYIVSGAGAQQPASSPAPRRIHCPILADASIFTAPGDRNANSGAAETLEIRACDQFALFQFDLTALDGLQVQRATLRLNRGNDLLVRVGVSTVAATWLEGSGGAPPPPGHVHTAACRHGRDVVESGACYNASSYSLDMKRARFWAGRGSDITDVIFGNGGSRWAPSVARLDLDSGYYSIEIPPAMVQAMVLGIQPGGLALSDDFNRSEPEPTVYSRESKYPPELIVEAVPMSAWPVAVPEAVRVERDGEGFEWLRFRAPDALGFEAYLGGEALASGENLDAARLVPLHFMPTPGAGELAVLLSLSRWPEDRYVAVRTVNAAGRWSAATAVELPAAIDAEGEKLAPTKLPRFPLPESPDRPYTMDDGVTVSLDGRYVRSRPETWWDPQSGPVALESGRGEFVGFQVVLAGGGGEYAVRVGPWESPDTAEPAPRVRLYRGEEAQIKRGREKYVPEVARPLADGEAMRLNLLTAAEAARRRAETGVPASAPSSTSAATGSSRLEVTAAVLVEVFVPRGTARGAWRSRVSVTRDGAEVLSQAVELNVVDATLPDVLRFAVSLSSPAPLGRRTGDGQFEVDWDALNAMQRLAHEHRATLAVVPFGPDGKPYPGFAPVPGSGPAEFDWSDWDRRFGPWLDGSAFSDLPRSGVPVEHFFLPLCENWPISHNLRRAPAEAPLNMKYHYLATWSGGTGRRNPRRDQYLIWPFQHLVAESERGETERAVAAVAEHLGREQWAGTRFQVYFNPRALPRRVMPWWRLSPPETVDDFRGLAFWLRLLRGGLPTAAGAKFEVRADNKWPQFQRDLLDGCVDVTALDSTLWEKSDLLVLQRSRWGRLWSDEGETEPEFGWNAVLRWGWSARLAGASGLVVARGVGTPESRVWADDSAMLLPAEEPGGAPLASMRLKALRRAQQDVEWIESRIARAAARGVPSGYVTALVGEALVERVRARVPERTALRPLIGFERDVDLVGLEEVRRAVRAGN